MAIEPSTPQAGLSGQVGDKVSLSWADVFARILRWQSGSVDKPIKVFGIPRGGAIVAGLMESLRSDLKVVFSPDSCDVIVDDILDSGETAMHWARRHSKPVWCLVDKRRESLVGRWIEFPWERGEREDDSDPHRSVTRLLEHLGEDPKREGLLETPRRVIGYLTEMTEGYRMNPAEILQKRFTEKCDEMIVVRDIPFWSLCEHHVLPFKGVASVGYIPKDQVIGLSKVARLVHCFAKRLQVQERLTGQIANCLMTTLEPQGVGVVIRAEHLCLSMRGAKAPSEMVTSSMLGLFREDPRARSEFLDLIRSSNGLKH